MTEHARPFERHPPHGSLAEEAARLAEAAQQWLAQRGSGDPARVWADATAQEGPPECRGCPVCRARRRLDEVSPDVYEHLADAAASLTAALRSFRSGGGDRSASGP